MAFVGSEVAEAPLRVSVKELHRRTDAIVASAHRGRRIEIIEEGEAIVELRSLEVGAGALQRLIDAGLVDVSGVEPEGLAGWRVPRREPGDPASVSDTLIAMRDEERY
jgi:hypothetical protein